MPASKAPFVDVVVFRPLPEPLTYSVPQSEQPGMAAGQRVWVPLGRARKVLGVVVGQRRRCDLPRLRPIVGRVDQEPLLSAEILKLTEWMAGRYACSWGEAISAVLPQTLRQGRPYPSTFEADTVSSSASSDAGVPIDVPAAVSALLRQDGGGAWLAERRAERRLELWAAMAQQALEQGRSALIVLPEVALVSWAMERLQSWLTAPVRRWDSQLTVPQQLKTWMRLREDQPQVVVGSRSSVLVPVRSLGVIVLDDEIDQTYKQERLPRYHARDVAEYRAREHGAVLVAGGSTVSLAIVHAAQERGWVRMRGSGLRQTSSRVHVVDLRDEPSRGRRRKLISRHVAQRLDALGDTDQRAILYLNRRGFATYVACQSCGHVSKCETCQVSLTFHHDLGELACHYCDRREEPVDLCPECGEGYLRFSGVGTERVESELNRRWPDLTVARMDADAVKHPRERQDTINAFQSGEIQVLIGTQILVHGSHQLDADLVVAVAADLGLNRPSFRAAEETFSRLCQLTTLLPHEGGELLVQTYCPEHSVFRALSVGRPRQFWDEELDSRKALGYPPYRHVIEVSCIAEHREHAEDATRVLIDRLARRRGLTVLGPSPGPPTRGGRKARSQVLLKGASLEQMVRWVREASDGVRKIGKARLAVDVDPL